MQKNSIYHLKNMIIDGMDMFKKLGESVKKAEKSISNEVKTRQEISRTKSRILDSFEMEDLKGICKAYGIGEPSHFEEDFFGEKSLRKATREHYIDWIMERITLDQLKNFCDKRGIKIWDIVEDKIPEPTPIAVEEVKKPTIVETLETKEPRVEGPPQFTQREELAGISAKLFSPVGKNPYYRGEKAIRNLRELKESLDEFTENEAEGVAQWIEYLGDTNTAARIRQTPSRFKELITIRFNELLPYAS